MFSVTFSIREQSLTLSEPRIDRQRRSYQSGSPGLLYRGRQESITRQWCALAVLVASLVQGYRQTR